MIAHRLSTIRKADVIFVVKDGTVREQGTHEELMKLGGIYAQLHDLQFQQTEEDVLVGQAGLQPSGTRPIEP